MKWLQALWEEPWALYPKDELKEGCLTRPLLQPESIREAFERCIAAEECATAEEIDRARSKPSSANMLRCLATQIG